MSEWALVWMTPFRLLPTSILMICYVIGGRQWKWMRRFVGSILFTGGCVALDAILHHVTWKSFMPIFLCVGFSMGYGGDTMREKFFKRFIYGLIIGLIGFGLGFLNGVWVLGLFQLVLALQVSLLLGLTNPTDAVDEEAIIAVLSVIIIPFMLSHGTN